MKIAIITPYFKEHTGMLERCHRSVKAQTHAQVRHFMISDGVPNAAVDGWDCEHIKIPNCGDVGDTPRGIGAAIASIQGYDGICFVDADCWIEPDHVEELLAEHRRSGAAIITCPRNLYRHNSTFMRVDVESNGKDFNDTNCYLFTKSAFGALRAWVFKTKEQALFGDRELWKNILALKLSVSRSLKATLNYTTLFAAHYVGIGEEPPPFAKTFVTINGKTVLATLAAIAEFQRQQKNSISAYMIRGEDPPEDSTIAVKENGQRRVINFTEFKKRLDDEIELEYLQNPPEEMPVSTKPVSIVCWLWNDDKVAYKFKPEYVNVLARMIKRNITVPHKLVCITDEPAEAFDAGIEIMPVPPGARMLSVLRTPEGGNFPTCYRRLWMFSEEAKALGEKVLLIDIDSLIVGNIDRIVSYEDDFVGWQPVGRAANEWGNNYFLGALWLHKPGTRTHIWTDFIENPQEAIKRARSAGFRGSDQAWISYNTFGKEKKFDAACGLYTIDFASHVRNDASIIQFNGPAKPWDSSFRIVKKYWK